MKRLFLPTILFFLSQQGISQEWAPIGATWHYETSDGFAFRYVSYELMESVGDTLIGGQNAKILVDDFYTYYAYEDSSKVYLYDDSVNAFTLLYDFSANKGDSFLVKNHFMWGDSFYSIVDSVFTIDINGNTTRVQDVHSSNPLWGYGDAVIENIGSIWSFVPWYALADPGPGPLRCYEDTIIGLLQGWFYHYTWRQNIPCDTSYYDIWDGVNEVSAENSITLYPIPTKNSFKIITDQIDYPLTILLTGVDGRELKKINNYTGEEIIIEEFESGIYFVGIYKEGEVVTWKKIIKE